ncbi:hypothetical protein M758_9G135800 [Ceratodon purpureus]|nr:hypothetical protein M758_9G135800 [Ceratodon purpureus]
MLAITSFRKSCTQIEHTTLSLQVRKSTQHQGIKKHFTWVKKSEMVHCHCSTEHISTSIGDFGRPDRRRQATSCT